MYRYLPCTTLSTTTPQGLPEDGKSMNWRMLPFIPRQKSILQNLMQLLASRLVTAWHHPNQTRLNFRPHSTQKLTYLSALI